MHENRKGKPRPDTTGLYPAFRDLYHGLTVVMQDAERESLEWVLHPWIDELGVTDDDWDCDFATWEKHFSGSLPSAAFRVDLSRKASDSELPPNVHVRALDGGWVVRDDKGWYWCGLVENGWTGDAYDEVMVPLRFESKRAAAAALLGASTMYAERNGRYEAAADLLGLTADERVG